MKFLIALVALIALVFADQKAWEAFKLKHDKTYESKDEEERRYHIFLENLEKVNTLNAETPDNQVFGVTPFMDLDQIEFKRTYLMGVDMTKKDAVLSEVEPETVDIEALPTSFDWSSKGALTPVKNQGQCGSCWDFSATETMESVCFLAGYPLTKFSEQQIVDCDHDGVYGCNGGFPWDAYKYIIQVGGIESEADYPYTARDGQCQFDKSKVQPCKITSWQWVSQSAGDEDKMQQFCYANSPLSICVDAAQWQYYSGGVLMASQCGQQLDHCVQITGWKVVDGTKAWRVRNSWGENWGEAGYIYLQYGQNTCGLATDVTVPCATSTSGKKFC